MEVSLQVHTSQYGSYLPLPPHKSQQRSWSLLQASDSSGAEMPACLVLWLAWKSVQVGLLVLLGAHHCLPPTVCTRMTLCNSIVCELSGGGHKDGGGLGNVIGIHVLLLELVPT